MVIINDNDKDDDDDGDDDDGDDDDGDQHDQVAGDRRMTLADGRGLLAALPPSNVTPPLRLEPWYVHLRKNTLHCKYTLHCPVYYMLAWFFPPP